MDKKLPETTKEETEIKGQRAEKPNKTTRYSQEIKRKGRDRDK